MSKIDQDYDDFETTINDARNELSNYMKVIKLFEKFENDLNNVDKTLTEQVTVNNLIKKPYQSLINIMNRNSSSLKQKTTVEAKLDKLDENIKILASIVMKQCSLN